MAIAESERKLEEPHDVLVPVEDRLPDMASAITLLAHRMKAVFDSMAPDDLMAELNCEREGTKSSAHLKLRAYKRTPTE
jgi:hypothetical protein